MVNVGKYTYHYYVDPMGYFNFEMDGIESLPQRDVIGPLGTQIICIHFGDDFLCEKSVCDIVEGNQVGSLCI